MGLGEVVEHLCTVGVERPRCQHVLDAELVSEALQGRADALEGNARPSDRGERVCLGEADEGHRDPGIARKRGDDSLAYDGTPVVGRTLVAMRPGAEGRHRDVDVVGRLGHRIERHVEALVGGAMG